MTGDDDDAEFRAARRHALIWFSLPGLVLFALVLLNGLLLRRHVSKGVYALIFLVLVMLLVLNVIRSRRNNARFRRQFADRLARYRNRET